MSRRLCRALRFRGLGSFRTLFSHASALLTRSGDGLVWLLAVGCWMLVVAARISSGKKPREARGWDLVAKRSHKIRLLLRPKMAVQRRTAVSKAFGCIFDKALKSTPLHSVYQAMYRSRIRMASIKNHRQGHRPGALHPPYAPCLNWPKNSHVSVAENVWFAPFITGVWL